MNISCEIVGGSPLWAACMSFVQEPREALPCQTWKLCLCTSEVVASSQQRACLACNRETRSPSRPTAPGSHRPIKVIEGWTAQSLSQFSSCVELHSHQASHFLVKHPRLFLPLLLLLPLLTASKTLVFCQPGHLPLLCIPPPSISCQVLLPHSPRLWQVQSQNSWVVGLLTLQS